MGIEIDLMANYPKTKRNLEERASARTEEDRRIARQFGQEFFDGDRRHGYGGFGYQARFWEPVVPTFRDYYGLGPGSRVLDVGCAKGFMVYDFGRLIPGLEIEGVDVSSYAIENAHPPVRDQLQVANATELPFDDDSFDLVISINTLHNLEGEDCDQAFREVQRVSRKHAFITVDAYRNAEEKQRMGMWNLTALTYMSTEDWVRYFADVGYSGDYYWFIP